MESLITAYLIALVAISSYLAWMIVQGGKLARRLKELQQPGDARSWSRQHKLAA